VAGENDVEAVRALVHEYAFRLDAGDLDGVAALFEHAELGSSVRPERMRGTDEARGYYRGVILYDDGTPRTMHCITNVTVDLVPNGLQASARSYFTVLQATDGIALQPIIAGKYHDRFELVGAGWRFTERIIYPDLIGDLSKHMRGTWIPR
jgi:SnoaL-like domain